jgi:predicted ATPase with chaperone activity
MVSAARQRGLKRVYVPARDAAEAALVEGLEVYAEANLGAMIDHLNGMSKLARYELPPRPAEVHRFCEVDEAGHSLLRAAMRQLNLSARGYHRILKLARTIADVAESEHIQVAHLAEAIQYRPWALQL